MCFFVVAMLAVGVYADSVANSARLVLDNQSGERIFRVRLSLRSELTQVPDYREVSPLENQESTTFWFYKENMCLEQVTFWHKGKYFDATSLLRFGPGEIGIYRIVETQKGIEMQVGRLDEELMTVKFR